MAIEMGWQQQSTTDIIYENSSDWAAHLKSCFTSALICTRFVQVLKEVKRCTKRRDVEP
ncbi:hypothetical protein CC1G_13613 [Coprinopsis cinerea okayama7|uniref:Uncharacterized protein n=1 Tax=Coprinopsis cinerea (strain Okayama-7 / 130 / ATCC MYA-4618 / FGSC 9003) TaxID=240176 RepID=D6RJW8_COPC7|nr:hypothetical protein CC1G_13613 [Coprinopsis cinerea okayama7\|eukprot:XP_002912080.1 hypothetical protein CC1G_13613 [Coprinopsis cinerea okayama7\